MECSPVIPSWRRTSGSTVYSVKFLEKLIGDLRGQIPYVLLVVLADNKEEEDDSLTFPVLVTSMVTKIVGPIVSYWYRPPH